ncbi:hypothetical protein A3L04_09665 [Thermococcus chitonophagus]|uniref:ABC transporter, ATP-binding protein n=1 Tax=Thermococcus chitonophagus TaxID=54262 RepID=A0A160VSD7_9EURY|nr:ABC transporter ATP-binding protein [Thermococcus chitonophagus]ASJ17316.1 hypothetical protein A3L04_09665 [Thermococcus chitonophagus]CUX77947.1 ABC transporter, ATP-binding protein [Thermococcus chitonophagus]
MAIIEFEGVELGYNGRPVLKVKSLDIEEGITCLIGPNGSGKTTFLRGVSGILKPIKGKIKVYGYDLFSPEADNIRPKIGLLPENSSPYPDMTVIEYLKYWAEFYGTSMSSVKRVLEMFDLVKIKDKLCSALSQGQKRRVMLARIFLIKPKLLVLDEPTANLDPEVSYNLMKLIARMGREIPIIYSTHLLREVEHVFDRLLFIKNGKIVANYTRDDVEGMDLYEVYMKVSGGITE